MSGLRLLFGLGLAAGLVVAACTSGGGASPTTGATVTIGTASSASLGTFLTGPDGKTLYVHAGDSMNTSTCTGGCLTAWPPLKVQAGQQPTGGPGVTGHLGTFTGPNGGTWVTYGGLPLYYWQGDAKPGDTTGQGVNGFTVALVSGAGSSSGTGTSTRTPSPTRTPAPSGSGGGYY